MVEIIFTIVFSAIVWDHFRRKGEQRLRFVRFLIAELMGRGFSLREIAYISSLPEWKVHAWHEGRMRPLIDDINAMQSAVLKARDSFIVVHQYVMAQRVVAGKTATR